MPKSIVIKALSNMAGVKPYRMKLTAKEFLNDFKYEKRTNFRQKLWAYKRGFLSSRIIDYRLDEENFKKYLSDWDYSKLFPLNNGYVKWIDDKLTTKYVLNKYNEYQPQYYFYLKQGAVLPSVDSPKIDNPSPITILKFLEEKGTLALKQELGSLGAGFYKIEKRHKKFYVNDELTSEEELIKLIESLNGYLVTEFIEAHEVINQIYPNTANAIRLTVFKDEENPSQLANAFIRFGTRETKGIDNASAGGLFSIIDIKDGSFENGYQKIRSGLNLFDTHPDTNEPIKATIPKWDFMVTKVLEISDYIGQLSWLGFDVVVTKEGFKILEINSHQEISWYQYFNPLLEETTAAEFLNKKLNQKKL